MLQLLAVSILWALSFGLTAQVSGLGAPLVAFSRSVLAALVLLPFLRVRGLGAVKVLAMAGVGGLQFGLMYVFYVGAFRWLRPGEVALFTLFTPLYVSLAGGILERRLAWKALGAALLAAVGTGICLWTSLRRPGLALGFLWMQISNLAFALGQVLYRRWAPGTGRTDVQLMGLLYLGATLVTGLLFLPGLHLGRLAWATPGQLLVLLHLGMVASGLGFLLFNAGARRVSLGALAVFNNAKVPLALLAAALVFREKVDWVRLAAGGTLIALALLLDAGRPPRTEALPGGV